MTDAMILQALFFVIAQITGGVAIYAGIRADMREHKVRISILEDWKKEHKC